MCVGGVQAVEDRTDAAQQGVVVRLGGTRAGYDRGETRRLRNRHATDIEVMHQRAETGETAVIAQPKAGQQYLEGYPCAAMGERSTVEVKADRILRAVPGGFHPHEFRLAIDEAADQPRGRDPIDPQVFARRPQTSAVLRRITTRHGTARGMGLIG